MERIGPFELERPLGDGGSAVVFLGRRRGTDEHVAIKVLRSEELLDRARFRREVQILRALTHPGIVGLVDHGVDEGSPWYAMELLGGGTLHDLCNRPPSGSADQVTLDVILTLVSGVCKALAHLHGRGIVHCDVKPRNIFLRDRHTSVLGDFGLVSRFGAHGREILQIEERIVGSSAYMAPEQLRGELLDARCDLYSLGCSLFESVSGRLPFVGSDEEVVRQHLGARPPRLRDHASVPVALDELVAGLLEKDPRNRIGFANDVRRVLDELTGADDEGYSSTPYLFRPELVGRRETLDVVLDQFDDLEQGRGAMTLVRGESGVGKTRLAMEIGLSASAHHIRVITAVCVDVSAQGATRERLSGGPLHPFRSVLQAIADECFEDPESSRRWLGSDLAVLAPFEPSLASLPHARRTPEQLPPRGARRRVIDAMIGVLRSVASRRPLVLIIDDLQWADDLTLAVLERLADSGMEDVSLCVVGTVRSEDSTPDLLQLRSRELVRTVSLDRLEEACVGDLVGGMLGTSSPPPPLISFVAQVSEGNPFFVAEYLRLAVEQRLLVRTASGTWQAKDGAQVDAYAAMELPRSLAMLVKRRIANLEPATRDALERATVLGREFDVETLELATGQADLAPALEELMARQILEEVDTARLRFVHDKLREIPYDAIPQERCRELHRSVAEALAARLGENDADQALFASLGLHWSQAGIPHSAAQCFRRAADHALANYANGSALSLYRSALREAKQLLKSEHDLLPTLYERLGDTLTREGDHHDAEQAFKQAIERLPERGTRTGGVHRKIAKTHEFRMNYPKALETLQSAERALGQLEENDEEGWHAWIWSLLDQIWVYYWRNELDGMERAIKRVDPVIEARGTAAHRARLYIGMALFGYRADRYVMSSKTVAVARKGLIAAEETGDLNVMTEARYILGLALLFSDQLLEARDQLTMAVGLARESGSAQSYQLSLSYLTLAHRRLRQVEQTLAYVEQLREEEEGLPLVWSGLGQANLAWVALSQRRHEDAAAHVEAAMAAWAGMKMPYPFQWTALFVRLNLQLRDHDPGWARTVEALLGPKLHRLPDDIVGSIEDALRALGEGEPEPELHAWTALDLARKYDYL